MNELQPARRAPRTVLVDDTHARLSATRVREVLAPRSALGVASIVADAARRGLAVTVAGGRNAMARQAFGTDAVLVDTRALTRVRGLDRAARLLEVEAGIQWPELIAATHALDLPGEPSLGIVQKQTGADRISLGGSVAVNAHGRGLTLPPLGGQVEALEVVRADGSLVWCSREVEPELFGLVLGGYGLCGITTAVSLRLTERVPVRRKVEVRTTDGLMGAMHERAAQGFRFGDFQFDIDPASDGFLRRGVFSCYEPTAAASVQRVLSHRLDAAAWRELAFLAHTDKRRAFELYAAYYMRSDGQVYWSDTHQLATYVEGYHEDLDARLGATCRGTEVITELYAPRAGFEAFLVGLRAALRETAADVVYGTIRVIERDDDAFLAWAREPWACVVLNLHVEHSPEGLARAQRQFRAAIDAALEHGGSFYLPYHAWATGDQLRAGHPRLEAFLARKAALDPRDTLRSDWLTGLRATLGGSRQHSAATPHDSRSTGPR
jgi:FAD/FMN-containing dehydrogenase